MNVQNLRKERTTSTSVSSIMESAGVEVTAIISMVHLKNVQWLRKMSVV